MRLETNYKKKTTKTQQSSLNNMLLKTNGSTNKPKRKSKNTWRQLKTEKQIHKIYGIQQKQLQEGSLQLYKFTSENNKNLKLTI